ncbi:sodium-dependent glucose transporter 1-like [Brevipalpus obovatus]|uniref:sodium-dependent glucose transporter 1-like n=1 Tax=Brevipalpus obovatus TaxID=246614 RepID=UPI003D9E3FE4
MDVQHSPSNDATRKTIEPDKFILLLSVYSLSFALGLVYEILSPTLDDLALISNSSTTEISSLFQFRSGAYALGSLSGAGIYHVMMPILSIICALLISSMSISWIGWLKNLRGMVIAISINGFTSGIMEVGMNVCLLRLYPKNSGPYMMALYAVFAIGCTLLNIYTAPFLSERNANSSSFEEFLEKRDIQAFQDQIITPSHGAVWVPFLITGILVLLPMILFIILFFRQISHPPDQRLPFITSRGERDRIEKFGETFRSRYTRILIILSGLMIMFYSGIDIVFSEYLVVTLKRSKLDITATEASYMKSAMYISQTVSKFSFIYISTLVRPFIILTVDCFITLFASVVLILSFDRSISIIWAFFVVLGISTSSLYSAMFPFIAEYLSIDHLNGSLLIFLGSIMAIIYPSIVGSFLDQQPAIILYLQAGTMIVIIIIAFLIRYIGRNHGDQKVSGESR